MNQGTFGHPGYAEKPYTAGEITPFLASREWGKEVFASSGLMWVTNFVVPYISPLVPSLTGSGITKLPQPLWQVYAENQGSGDFHPSHSNEQLLMEADLPRIHLWYPLKVMQDDDNVLPNKLRNSTNCDCPLLPCHQDINSGLFLSRTDLHL